MTHAKEVVERGVEQEQTSPVKVEEDVIEEVKEESRTTPVRMAVDNNAMTCEDDVCTTVATTSNAAWSASLHRTRSKCAQDAVNRFSVCKTMEDTKPFGVNRANPIRQKVAHSADMLPQTDSPPPPPTASKSNGRAWMGTSSAIDKLRDGRDGNDRHEERETET